MKFQQAQRFVELQERVRHRLALCARYHQTLAAKADFKIQGKGKMSESFDQVPFHGEFVENPEPRCPCLLLLDTSGSMNGSQIDRLRLPPRMTHRV